jgi:oligoribonuclease NrnB/cAMP/cGMP phosphodiesterase (DHH superfamily)
LQAYHYHSWRQRTLKERAAWVCDLSFEPRLDKLGWVVIDHHPTECQPKNALLVHDLNKSAGLLCYELCQEHEVQSPILDRLVHLNNVADLFLEDDPDFIVAGDYANLVKTYQFWNLHVLIGGDLEKLFDHPLLEVMAVKRRIENPLGFAWSKDNVVEIVQPSDLWIRSGNNNLIVHQLGTASHYASVLLTLFRKAGGRLSSYGGRNGEALRIAEQLQGGGHPNACGATLPRRFKYLEAIDYLRKVLNPSPTKGLLNSLEACLTLSSFRRNELFTRLR